METLARIPDPTLYAIVAMAFGLLFAFLIASVIENIRATGLRQRQITLEGEGLHGTEHTRCRDASKHALVWDPEELDFVRTCGCPQPYTRKRFKRDLNAVIDGDMSVEQLHEKICAEGGQIPKRERVVPPTIQKARETLETLARIRKRLLCGCLSPVPHEPVLKDTASANSGQMTMDGCVPWVPYPLPAHAPFKVGDWVVVKDRWDRALAEVVGYHPGPEGNMVRVRFEWAEVLLRAESLMHAQPAKGEWWAQSGYCSKHFTPLMVGLAYRCGESPWMDDHLSRSAACGCAKPIRYGKAEF